MNVDREFFTLMKKTVALKKISQKEREALRLKQEDFIKRFAIETREIRPCRVEEDPFDFEEIPEESLDQDSQSSLTQETEGSLEAAELLLRFARESGKKK